MRQAVLKQGPEVRRRLLMGVVFLLPLFFLPGAYSPFNVPKLWLVMVGAIVVLAIRCVELLQGGDRAGLDLMVVPAAVVAVPLLVATVFSPYRVWSIIGDHSRFTGLLPYLTVVVLGVLIADSFRGDVRPLVWAVVVSGALAGAYAVVQVVGLDPLEWSGADQATVTIGNTNFSGAFFAICLCVALGLVFSEAERRVLAVSGLGLIVVGWFLARSELAWAAGLAGAATYFGIVLSRRWRFARIAGLAGAAVIALGAVGVVAAAGAGTAADAIPASIERRAEWWQASLRMVASSPIVGEGPNSFAVEHTHHRDIDDALAVGFDVTTDPHSVPLSFLTAAGVVGFAGFLAFGGWLIARTANVASDDYIGAAVGAGGVAYLVQSLLSIDVITLRSMAWVLAGALAAATASLPVAAKSYRGKRKKKEVERQEPLRALPAVVAVILVMMGMAGWATGFLSADVRFRRGLAMAAGGLPGAKENLDAAVGFRETNYAYRVNYGGLLAGNAVQEGLSDEGDLPVATELMAEAEDVFSFVIDFPHSQSVLQYARAKRDWAQVDESAEDEALELYERALELDPYNFRILEEQALAAETFGREELAAKLYAQSVRMRESAES